MNREEYLAKHFPTEDGLTYINSLDKHNKVMAKYKYLVKLTLEVEYDDPMVDGDTTHFKTQMANLIAKESLEEMLENKSYYVTLKKEINQDNLNGSVVGDKTIFVGNE